MSLPDFVFITKGRLDGHIATVLGRSPLGGIEVEVFVPALSRLILKEPESVRLVVCSGEYCERIHPQHEEGGE